MPRPKNNYDTVALRIITAAADRAVTIVKERTGLVMSRSAAVSWCADNIGIGGEITKEKINAMERLAEVFKETQDKTGEPCYIELVGNVYDLTCGPCRLRLDEVSVNLFVMFVYGTDFKYKVLDTDDLDPAAPRTFAAYQRQIEKVAKAFEPGTVYNDDD